MAARASIPLLQTVPSKFWSDVVAAGSLDT